MYDNLKHYCLTFTFNHVGMPSCCGLSVIHGLSATYSEGTPNHMPSLRHMTAVKAAQLQKVLDYNKTWGDNSGLLLRLRQLHVPMTFNMAFATILDQVNLDQMHLVSDNTMRGRSYDVEYKPTDFIKWLRHIGVKDIDGPIGYNTGRKNIEVHGFRLRNFDKNGFMAPYRAEAIKIAEELLDGYKKQQEERRRIEETRVGYTTSTGTG